MAEKDKKSAFDTLMGSVDAAAAPYISDLLLKYGGKAAGAIGADKILHLFSPGHLIMAGKALPGIGGALSEQLPSKVFGSTFVADTLEHVFTQASHSLGKVLAAKGGDPDALADEDVGKAVGHAFKATMSEAKYVRTKEGVLHGLPCAAYHSLFGDAKPTSFITTGEVIELIKQGAPTCPVCFEQMKREIEKPIAPVAAPKKAKAKSAAERLQRASAADRETIFGYISKIQDPLIGTRYMEFLNDHLDEGEEVEFLAWSIRHYPDNITFALSLLENGSLTYQAKKQAAEFAETIVEVGAPIVERLRARVDEHGNECSTFRSVVGSRRRPRKTFWESLFGRRKTRQIEKSQ